MPQNKSEESYIVRTRRLIEEQYKDYPTSCGGGFGELLCCELHTEGLHFKRLAEKWGITVTLLGELVYDHCKRLEVEPVVKHDYNNSGDCCDDQEA